MCSEALTAGWVGGLGVLADAGDVLPVDDTGVQQNDSRRTRWEGPACLGLCILKEYPRVKRTRYLTGPALLHSIVVTFTSLEGGCDHGRGRLLLKWSLVPLPPLAIRSRGRLLLKWSLVPLPLPLAIRSRPSIVRETRRRQDRFNPGGFVEGDTGQADCTNASPWTNLGGLIIVKQGDTG